jgi:hypothetical protein
MNDAVPGTKEAPLTTIRSKGSSALAGAKAVWDKVKPKKHPESGPKVEADHSSVKGLDRLHTAAKTGMLEAPPWEPRGEATRKLDDKYGDKLDPKTIQRLDSLEKKGKLTAKEGNRTLAGEIDKLLKNGCDPKIIDAIVRQLTNPTAHIKQADAMSCVATDGQIQMAMFTPARYMAFMGNLMQEGKAGLAGFGDINLGKERFEHNMGAKGWNAKLNEMAQEAFMGLAKGSGAEGTSFSEGMKFLQKLTGMPVLSPDMLRNAVEDGQKNGVSRNETTQKVLQMQLAHAFMNGEKGLFVALSHGHTNEAHMVMITGIDAKGNVTYSDGINPPGSMPLEEFAKHTTMYSSKDLGAGRVLRVVPPPSGEV